MMRSNSEPMKRKFYKSSEKRGKSLPNLHLQYKKKSHVTSRVASLHYVTTPSSEVVIDGITLNYRIYNTSYVITYLTNYSIELEEQISYIYIQCIEPLHQLCRLQYTNLCGPNSENLCNEINQLYDTPQDGVSIKSGKLIITEWKYLSSQSKNIILNVKYLYGLPGVTLNATYHALTYIVITLPDNEYHIAVETTIQNPYKDQFYVGTSQQELREILLARYLCQRVIYTFNCNKEWYSIYDGATPRTNRLGEDLVEMGKPIKGGRSKKRRRYSHIRKTYKVYRKL
jgi:hypothetical protein